MTHPERCPANHEHHHSPGRRRDHRRGHAEYRGDPHARGARVRRQAAPQFEPRRRELLAARARAPGEFDAGEAARLPARDRGRSATADWKVAPAPRRPAATAASRSPGPTDRKMVINALNCGAQRLHGRLRGLATRPTWDNMIEGQINLRDAVRRTIDFTSPEGKALQARTRRPRCCSCARAAGTWTRSTCWSTASRSSARIFDFGALLLPQRQGAARARHRARTSTCPKMESHLEARLWNDIFVHGAGRARHAAGHDQGHRADRDRCSPRSRWTRSCTSCASTRPASTSAAGTTSSAASRNSARNPDFCLADRAQVTMTAPFMRAYALLLVKTCHRRGAHAMGGMAAQIPIKNDPAANEAALGQGARRQGARGHRRLRRHLGGAPGPGADRARRCSTSTCRQPNQIDRSARGRARHGRATCSTSSPRRRSPRPACATTSASASSTSAPGCAGNGCVPVYNLMEDAATAEISRSQIWQWIRSPKGVLDDGRKVDARARSASCSPRSSRRARRSATRPGPRSTSGAAEAVRGDQPRTSTSSSSRCRPTSGSTEPRLPRPAAGGAACVGSSCCVTGSREDAGPGDRVSRRAPRADRRRAAPDAGGGARHRPRSGLRGRRIV